MKRQFTFILIGCLLIACSPQKRMNRLLSRHPELMRTFNTTDTVHTGTVIADTVFIDTSAHSFSHHDTIFLSRGRLEVKYFRSRDTVFLSGKCKDSVIVKEVKAREVLVEKKGLDWWKWILAITVSLVIIGIVIKKL